MGAEAEVVVRTEIPVLDVPSSELVSFRAQVSNIYASL